MATELTPIDQHQYPVLQPGAAEALAEVLTENFGADGLQPSDLDRIKIPGGGGTAWEVPSLTGAEMAKSIEGIILFWQSPRKWWQRSVEEVDETTPPDCSSDDSKLGFGAYGVGSDQHPSGECATCPMNQWGTAKDSKGEPGKGKACREGRLLFLLRAGDTLPVAVDLPPTSIGPLRKYMLRLANAVKPYYAVTTKIELKPEQDGGKRWSTAIPTMGGEIPTDSLPAVKAFAASLEGAVTRRRTADTAAPGAPGAPKVKTGK